MPLSIQLSRQFRPYIKALTTSRGEWGCLGHGAQWNTAILSYLLCHEYTVTSSEGS